jgi:NADH dehydrogenase
MGDGEYKVQPVCVADLGSIAYECATQDGPKTVDAIGSETYTYRQLVETISVAMGKNVKYVNASPEIGILLGKFVGFFLRDVILTKNELRGLMDNLLTSQQEPNGPTNFSDWLRDNRHTIGSSYSSELDRHFRWLP